jgi:hypothetical protein
MREERREPGHHGLVPAGEDGERAVADAYVAAGKTGASTAWQLAEAPMRDLGKDGEEESFFYVEDKKY